VHHQYGTNGDAVALNTHDEAETAVIWLQLTSKNPKNVSQGSPIVSSLAAIDAAVFSVVCDVSSDRGVRRPTYGVLLVIKPRRIAFIGNSLPRRCGIATFTTHLHQAVVAADPDIETAIVAMTDHNHEYEYPADVGFQIRDDKLEDYFMAAEYLNTGNFDVVCLQHEFGIFGGEAGSHLMLLLTRLKMPIVTTLHTVLAEPTPMQRRIIREIIDLSSKVIVMAEKGRNLLQSVYGASAAKIELIAHGIPDFQFLEPDAAKAQLGFADRHVILTFGLLSPNKGIEVMIDAMPSILDKCPDAVYVVLGATHPHLVRQHGESYRESLVARVNELGIGRSVEFHDHFVDQEMLLAYISMCDVYVTPYLNEAQMTSGTLAYSFGLGKAVVSTPYWHAQELLADDRGIIVPFGDHVTIGSEIGDLLTNVDRRQALRERAYTVSRAMTWEQSAKHYLHAFRNANRGKILKVISQPASGIQLRNSLPDMKLIHFNAMCDDTGIFQHAVHSVPDRLHGYCVDDNARALLVSCALNQPAEQPVSELLTSRFAAFVQHAWNPDTKRFRNFMSFDRRWLEPMGSEDSHGRTLWALGVCANSKFEPALTRWAAALFAEALPTVDGFQSPRAWAFTLLGLDSYCDAVPSDDYAQLMRATLADRLMVLIDRIETPDWVWFENGLSYDNARLSQALIVTGQALGNQTYTGAGLRSLAWLVRLQTTAAGLFRPVGSETFGDERKPPRPFDQQPVEATATISACLAAWNASGDAEWTEHAAQAFAWFVGENDLSLPLVDIDTGSCRDGLHPDRRNENRGAESVVCYLISLAEMRALARSALAKTSVAGRGVMQLHSKTTPHMRRERIAPHQFSEPPSPLPSPRSSESGRATVQTSDRTSRTQSN
jgi:glycosyltransferase involved in cell wall biosynthesis